jgi:glutathione synthase/RimK-type ligase-like ATP-grasp enzyme
MIKYDIGIIYEHPQWHEPLFNELEKRNISFEKIDLTNGFCTLEDEPRSKIYYNLVSPSAYNRGNQNAISFAYALCNYLESNNCTVLNGKNSMDLEISKSTQMMMLKNLNINYPKTHFFNNLNSLELNSDRIKFPKILKPQQGGSGSRIYKVHSFSEIKEIFDSNPNIWFPDNLFLLQNEIVYDREFGIVRLEFIGEKLLYAMRIITNGAFNLCPSVICNPENGEAGQCEIPSTKAPEFYSYNDIDPNIVETAKRIIKASGHSVASVEFTYGADGEAYFYDINSNSNLRENISVDFGSGNPFEKVVDYLQSQIKAYIDNEFELRK